MNVVEICDTPTGQVLHLLRFEGTLIREGAAYCAASLRDREAEFRVASPYYKSGWKLPNKPLCSRCLYNWELERKREREMIEAYR